MSSKNVLSTLLLFLFSYGAYAQTAANYNLQVAENTSWVQAKNYYFLTLLQQDEEVRKLIAQDPELTKLKLAKQAAIARAAKECKSITCFTEAAKFTKEEIAQVSKSLGLLYKPNNALEALLYNQLLPSGTYSLVAKKILVPGMLARLWEQDANTINYCIEVYGEGKKPNYPRIDSISFNVMDSQYLLILNTLSIDITREARDTDLFFTPTLRYSLHLLEINDRTQAGDYEPMSNGINKAAAAEVKKINWKSYKYSLILIPGAGPEKEDVALSAASMLRCRIAAELYKKGVAPFLMPSGGKVHPYKTPYSEAVEMKKYLVEVLNIPEKAIIAEPHARHTTTNLRNCVRLIYRMGIPADRPFVVSTDIYQSAFISRMNERCIKELGYMPYRQGDRLSETEQEIYPSKDALQIDTDEPLDP